MSTRSSRTKMIKVGVYPGSFFVPRQVPSHERVYSGQKFFDFVGLTKIRVRYCHDHMCV